MSGFVKRRAIVDPSLLFSRNGLRWLEEDADARERLVVSQTLVELIDGGFDVDPARMLAPDDLEIFDAQRGLVRDLVHELPRFTHRDVSFAHRSHEEVRSALAQTGDPLAEIYADEWAFVQSQSMLLSKLRGPLEAFRDAGATIVEVGRKTGIRLIERVIPAEHLPPEPFTRRVFATAAAKWVVLGGATVGGGTLGGVTGTMIAGPTGGFVGGKVGGFAAGAGASAALLAIDP